MGWSDMEARCKKHPSHRQSKGVCPSCLRDRLAHLSAASSSTTATTTSNGSDSSRASVYLSDSNNASGDASPPAAAASRAKMAALLRSRPEEPLTKSRSLAFVITAATGEAAEGKAKANKGAKGASSVTSKTKGFWARLMPGKARRRMDGLDAAAARDIAAGGVGGLHSKTVKETASARWVL